MAGDERTNRKKSTGEMSEFLREEEVRVEQEGNDLNNAYFYKISPVIVEIRKEGIELQSNKQAMDNFFFLFQPNHQQKPSFCFTHPFPAAPNLHLMERFLYLPFPETFQTQYSTQIEIDNSGPPATSGALVQSQTAEGRREGERSSSSRKTIIENIQILSAKKNSQHNLLSQFCSFFKSISRSGTVVQKILKTLQIEDNETVRKVIYVSANIIIDKTKRKYINLSFFRQLADPLFYKEELPELYTAFQNVKDVTLLKFCQAFSRILFYYFREVSTLAVLTSKRLKSVARKTHLQKGRKIVGRLQR